MSEPTPSSGLISSTRNFAPSCCVVRGNLPRPAPFSHPDWLFELKYDGFQSHAYFMAGSCELRSRNGNVFTRFANLAHELKRSLPGTSAVIDGEIVCLDFHGRPRSKDLLFRQRQLRRITRGTPILFADHVLRDGERSFRLACEHDLEGIVAKPARSIEGRDKSTWFKIRNRSYSQIEGRRELFDELRTAMRAGRSSETSK